MPHVGASTGAATIKVTSAKVAQDLPQHQRVRSNLASCVFSASPSTTAKKTVVFLYPKKKDSRNVRTAGGKYDKFSNRFYVDKSIFRAQPESFAKWIPEHVRSVKFESLPPVHTLFITGLDPSIDESRLLHCLKPYESEIISVSVKRSAFEDGARDQNVVNADIFMTRMQPLLAVAVPEGTEYTVVSSTVDVHLCGTAMLRLPTHRAAVRTAGQMNDEAIVQMGTLNEQQIRAHAKIFYSFTCDRHMYRVLRGPIAKILGSAANVGVNVQIAMEESEYRVMLSGKSTRGCAQSEKSGADLFEVNPIQWVWTCTN